MIWLVAVAVSALFVRTALVPFDAGFLLLAFAIAAAAAWVLMLALPAGPSDDGDDF